jgi:hypothetical protein
MANLVRARRAARALVEVDEEVRVELHAAGGPGGGIAAGVGALRAQRQAKHRLGPCRPLLLSPWM